MEDDGLTLNDFIRGVPTGEAGDAHAGAPIDPAKTAPASEEAVIEALRQVYDPEIPVNLYDLGLIYDLAIGADGSVAVTMTLTTPACPVAGILPQRVADAIAAVPGAGEVDVDLVWDPPWSMDRMTDEARLMLDLF